MTDSQELLKLKERIDKARTEANKIEGQIIQLEEQRLKDFGCATDEDANEYIKELSDEITELERRINDGITDIKQELGW